jgi:hypothetical protein
MNHKLETNLNKAVVACSHILLEKLKETSERIFGLSVKKETNNLTWIRSKRANHSTVTFSHEFLFYPEQDYLISFALKLMATVVDHLVMEL